MMDFIRYAGVILGILVLAVVLMACGEAACSACLYAYCGGSDRVDRSGDVIGRVLAACSLCATRTDAFVRQPVPRAAHPPGGWLSTSLFVTGVSALRM